MQMKNAIFDLLLLSVVLIFCGVIIYVAILMSSITIGMTLLPLLLFLGLTHKKKGGARNNA